MVRFACSLLVAALLLGSVGLCQYALTRRVAISMTHAPESHGHAEPAKGVDASARYALYVTLGFEAGEDPFAVRAADAAESRRLVIRHGGAELFATSEALQRGQQIAITNQHFSGERVALFVEAVPGGEDAARPCALRLRLECEGEWCDEATLWSEGNGARVSGEVTLGLAPRLSTLDRGLGVR
ncbi:MAG: hypothetical protein HQ523_08505 [Lentisphaerae bacterium]|nr:hypothetical protein [Lentisphaerota bacterium]